jgi:hypothetical protein
VDGRDVSYTTNAEGQYGVATATIAIQPSTVQLGEIPELKTMTLDLETNSSGLQPEFLTVQLQGLPGGIVNPTQIVAAPGKQTIHLTVGSTELLPLGPAGFALSFVSPQGTAQVENGTVQVQYTIRQSVLILPPETTDLGTLASLDNVRLVMNIKSSASQEQLLDVNVEGLDNAQVFPNSIVVPAAPDQQVTVVNGSVPFQYKTAGAGPPFLPIAVLCVGVGAVGFIGWRILRRRRA